MARRGGPGDRALFDAAAEAGWRPVDGGRLKGASRRGARTTRRNVDAWVEGRRALAFSLLEDAAGWLVAQGDAGPVEALRDILEGDHVTTRALAWTALAEMLQGGVTRAHRGQLAGATAGRRVVLLGGGAGTDLGRLVQGLVSDRVRVLVDVIARRPARGADDVAMDLTPAPPAPPPEAGADEDALLVRVVDAGSADALRAAAIILIPEPQRLTSASAADAVAGATDAAAVGIDMDRRPMRALHDRLEAVAARAGSLGRGRRAAETSGV